MLSAESCDRSSEGSPPEQRAPPAGPQDSSSLPNRVSLHPPAPKTEWGFGPLAPFPASPLHPAPTGTWLRASGHQLVRLAGAGRPWLRLPWEQTLASHAADLGVGGRAVWAGAAEDQEERRESGERARELCAGSAVSDFWRRPVRDRKWMLRGGAGGGHGRSPAATSSSLAAPPARPCDSSPSPSPNPKVLYIHEPPLLPPPPPSSSQLSRALHLPFPRHPPHTHSWVREPRSKDQLRAGARGLPSLKSPG